MLCTSCTLLHSVYCRCCLVTRPLTYTFLAPVNYNFLLLLLPATTIFQKNVRTFSSSSSEVSDTIITIVFVFILIFLQTFLPVVFYAWWGANYFVLYSSSNIDAEFAPYIPMSFFFVTWGRSLWEKFATWLSDWTGTFTISDTDNVPRAYYIKPEEVDCTPFVKSDLVKCLKYIKKHRPEDLCKVIAVTSDSATIVCSKSLKIGQEVFFLGGQTASVAVLLADDLFIVNFLAPPPKERARNPIAYPPTVGSDCALIDTYLFRHYYRPLP